MTEETLKEIEKELAELHDPNSEVRKRFDASQEKWDAITQPLRLAIRASERLTAEDMSIRFTPLPED